MPTQSLRPLLEALAAPDGVRQVGGAISDPDDLLAGGALERLDQAYPDKLFGLVLHDPAADAGVAAYLKAGSLPTDSGEGIVVLYEPAPRPRRLAPVNDIALSGENPIAAFARDLFPGTPLVLPGLVVLRRLAAPSDAVWVPLAGNQETVTASARHAFAAIARVAPDEPGKPFGERLGLALARDGIDYRRSEPIAVREHVHRLLRRLWNHRRDLAGFIPVVGKLLAKNA